MCTPRSERELAALRCCPVICTSRIPFPERADFTSSSLQAGPHDLRPVDEDQGCVKGPAVCS